MSAGVDKNGYTSKPYIAIDGNANNKKGTIGRPKIWRVYKRKDKKTSG